MANIRLKELVEANIDPKLVARSKETGKLVYFKNAQNKDALEAAGRKEESQEWFAKCAEIDTEEATDASERCL